MILPLSSKFFDATHKNLAFGCGIIITICDQVELNVLRRDREGKTGIWAFGTHFQRVLNALRTRFGRVKNVHNASRTRPNLSTTRPERVRNASRMHSQRVRKAPKTRSEGAQNAFGTRPERIRDASRAHPERVRHTSRTRPEGIQNVFGARPERVRNASRRHRERIRNSFGTRPERVR